MQLFGKLVMGGVTAVALAIAVFTAYCSADGGQVSPTQAQLQARYFNETDAAVRTRSGLKPLSAKDYASGQAILRPDVMTAFNNLYCSPTSTAGAMPTADSDLCARVDEALKTLPGLSSALIQSESNKTAAKSEILNLALAYTLLIGLGIPSTVGAGFVVYTLRANENQHKRDMRALDQATML